MTSKSPQNDEPLRTIEKQWGEIEKIVKGSDPVKHLKKSMKEGKENKGAIEKLRGACTSLIQFEETILKTIPELQKCAGNEETSQLPEEAAHKTHKQVKSDPAAQTKEAKSDPKQQKKDDKDSLKTCSEKTSSKDFQKASHSDKSKTVTTTDQTAKLHNKSQAPGPGGSRLSPAPNKTKDENSSKKEAKHKKDQSPSPGDSKKQNEMDGTKSQENAVQRKENLPVTAQIAEDKGSCATRKDGKLPAKEKEPDESSHTKKLEEEDLKETLEQRKQELAECHKEKEKLRDEKNDCVRHMEELCARHQSDIQRLKAKLEKWEIEMQNLRKQKDDIIKRLENENKDLFSKYSSMASDRMERDNPDVADLSDEFRATNIAEKYRELYDKPWTNAFRAQHKDRNKDKKESLKILLHILTDTYTYCEGLAKKQEMTLKNVFQFPVQNLKEQGKQRKPIEMKPKQLETLMKLRKQIAVESVKDVADSYLNHIKQKSSNGEGETPKSLDEASKAYIQKCVEVCWPMVLNNPPLYMETAVKPGEPVNEDVYNLRSPGENVEMLIWPPLYLGKGGELLAKGIVDGQKMDTETAI